MQDQVLSYLLALVLLLELLTGREVLEVFLNVDVFINIVFSLHDVFVVAALRLLFDRAIGCSI